MKSKVLEARTFLKPYFTTRGNWSGLPRWADLSSAQGPTREQTASWPRSTFPIGEISLMSYAINSPPQNKLPLLPKH